MFDQLSERLQSTLSDVRKRGKLTEDDVDKAMREIRLALLEADVNFKVVKDFVGRVRERAVGQDVLKSLSPYQMVIGIVNEELINTLGPIDRLNLSGAHPRTIMLIGLQGSGKTTTTAKIGSQAMAPIVTAQPANVSILPGESATFTASVAPELTVMLVFVQLAVVPP